VFLGNEERVGKTLEGESRECKRSRKKGRLPQSNRGIIKKGREWGDNKRDRGQRGKGQSRGKAT